MLVCLLFSRRCFHLKESPVFKRVPEASNRPGVVAKTVAQTTFRFGYWKWVELIAIFSRPTFLRPLFAPRPSCWGTIAKPVVRPYRRAGFWRVGQFPRRRSWNLIAANRLHSAVCQGGDLPQAQQSTVGGHERQAKHFCCSGQKAIRWIRMLKRQFLGYRPGFGKARANRLSWGKMAAAG